MLRHMCRSQAVKLAVCTWSALSAQCVVRFVAVAWLGVFLRICGFPGRARSMVAPAASGQAVGSCVLVIVRPRIGGEFLFFLGGFFLGVIRRVAEVGDTQHRCMTDARHGNVTLRSGCVGTAVARSHLGVWRDRVARLLARSLPSAAWASCAERSKRCKPSQASLVHHRI